MGRVYESDGVRWAEYVVGYLDILGQRDKLRVLSELPSSAAERDRFDRASFESFDVVRMIQEWLEHWFSEEGGPANAVSDYGSLSDIKRHEVDKLCGNELERHFFGDSFLIYGRLFNDDEEPAMANALALVSSLAFIMFMSMCPPIPIPLRGGIEVGVGAEMEGRGIYGPALIDTYRLEAEVAQYPRIVIGPRLSSRLSALAKSTENGQDLHDINVAFAKMCVTYIDHDIDGLPIVDHLGKGVRGVLGGRSLAEHRWETVEFVKRECERFAREKDTKLAFRYHLLRDYCLRRLSEWP